MRACKSEIVCMLMVFRILFIWAMSRPIYQYKTLFTKLKNSCLT